MYKGVNCENKICKDVIVDLVILMCRKYKNAI